MKKFCISEDFSSALCIQRFFAIPTDCFGENGIVIAADKLVAVDDDPIAAVYSSYLYFLIFKVYGFFPKILCVGGKGPLSKYTSEKNESEGKKLARVCTALGVRSEDVVVLDSGTNNGLNLKNIVTEAAKAPGKMILCLTQRLSSRVCLTLNVLENQYPEIGEEIKIVRDAGIYYYVPEQTVEEQLCKFNAKGFAGGLMWLAEIASLYDRYEKYSKNGVMQEIPGGVPEEVKAAHFALATKYPLKNGNMGLNFIWQFAYCWFEIMTHKKAIAEDLERLILFNREKLLRDFDFLEGIRYTENGQIEEIRIKA